MGTRPRTSYVKKLRARRCSRCHAKLNTKVKRCGRCTSMQPLPRKS